VCAKLACNRLRQKRPKFSHLPLLEWSALIMASATRDDSLPQAGALGEPDHKARDKSGLYPKSPKVADDMIKAHDDLRRGFGHQLLQNVDKLRRRQRPRKGPIAEVTLRCHAGHHVVLEMGFGDLQDWRIPLRGIAGADLIVRLAPHVVDEAQLRPFLCSVCVHLRQRLLDTLATSLGSCSRA
jgi:hypothetical protein